LRLQIYEPHVGLPKFAPSQNFKVLYYTTA